MDSIWSDNSSPSSLYFVYVIVFAFFFIVVRFLLDKFIFRRLATWMLCGTGSVLAKVRKDKKEKITKCSESMWKFTYYATVEVCILKIIYNEPWFRDGQGYFVGWPNQEFKVPLKLYSLCQGGFYLFSIFAILTWETRRKDFAVMMSHHAVTLFLIGLSYIMRLVRIGSIILALHDGSDVLMEGAKICKYTGNEIGASVLFGSFAISWLILRLIFFPFWVIKATSTDLCECMRLEGYDARLCYFINALLLILLVFHIYWFRLICAMIVKQLQNKGKIGEDIRSDSEDDD